MTTRMFPVFLCLLLAMAAVATADAARSDSSKRKTRTPSGLTAQTTASAGSRSDGIPAEIPVGTAESDPITSEAISKILEATADRYASVESFKATGVYIEAARASRGEKAVEEQMSSRLEVVYQRPDRLKVLVTGEEIAAGLVADGSTVTLLWPNEKEYSRLSQPESLAAFVEDERPGEILADDTNAVSYSVVGALLVSEDPLRWLHANVKTYVYDGVEEVRGRPAWRVKFLQTDPELVVINWIDQETKFLSKVSIIQARNEEGEFVESYADSSYGRIRIAILDDIRTGAKAVKEKEFKAPISRSWKPREEEDKPSFAGEADTMTPWERLVRAAAAKTGRETTVTLVAQSGGEAVRLTQVVERPGKVTALLASGDGVSTVPGLLAASAEKLVVLGSGGEILRSFSVTGTPGFLALLNDPQVQEPLIAVADSYGDSVRTYSPAGRPVWNYTHVGGRISSILAARPDGETTETLYVSFLGETGLRRLGPGGRVLFASRKLTGLTSLAAGEVPGYGWRLVASTGEGAGFYRPAGTLAEKFPEWSEDLQVGLLALDDAEASAPVLQVAAAGDQEYVLRRVRPDGSPVWTAPLVQGVKEAEPVGLTVARLRSQGREGRYIISLISDGRLVVVSADGEAVWRGKVVFGGEASSGDLEHTAAALLAADLDRDGRDEIYVGGEGSIVRLTFSDNLL